MVFQSRLRYPDNFIQFIILNSIAQQLQTGGLILRVQRKHLLQYRHRFFLHVLCNHVLGTQHRQIGILLRTRQDTLKQSDNLRTVLGGLLRLQDALAHQFHLRVRRYIVVHQNGVQLLLVQAILSGLEVIRCHRQYRRRIIRFLFQDALINPQRLIGLVIIQIDITQDGLVTQIVRIFLREVFNFDESTVLLAHQEIHPEFLHTDLLGLAIQLFQAVQRTDDMLVTLGPIIQVDQRKQRFQPRRELLRHILVHGNRLGKAHLPLVIRSQGLFVPKVRLVRTDSFFQRLFPSFFLPQIHIELGYLVQRRSRSGIDVQTMLEKFERRIVQPFLFHAYGFQEIIIVLPPFLEAKRTLRRTGIRPLRLLPCRATSHEHHHHAYRKYIE